MVSKPEVRPSRARASLEGALPSPAFPFSLWACEGLDLGSLWQLTNKKAVDVWIRKDLSPVAISARAPGGLGGRGVARYG